MAFITQNLKIRPEHYLISIAQSKEAVCPKPGQFYMLRCSPCTDPLLRRPLSIHNYFCSNDKNQSRLDFLYRVVGTGTKLLSRMRPGDHIELFGPLGKGFKIMPSLEYVLFIAGGVGIAPLPYLAERLVENQNSLHARLLLGARTAEHIFGLERLKKLGFEISIYTEDGTLGEQGCVTDHLDQALSSCLNKKSMVFACGPIVMLAKTAQKCMDLKISCQVSLEQKMACGVGACQGCVIRTSQETSLPNANIYKKVCSDGPVFYADEIQWSGIEGEDQCPL